MTALYITKDVVNLLNFLILCVCLSPRSSMRDAGNKDWW